MKAGIGAWNETDSVELLRSGSTPDEVKVTGSMREVVNDGTKYLTDADRTAIARYLQAQKPIAQEISVAARDNRACYRSMWDWVMGVLGS